MRGIFWAVAAVGMLACVARMVCGVESSCESHASCVSSAETQQLAHWAIFSLGRHIEARSWRKR
jgi:hypothetical protein